MKAKVSIVKCADYAPALVMQALEQAIGLIGGISSFIKPQSKVLVKPNLLMAKEPEAGITTHPQVIQSVVKMLKKINCRIIIGDAPSVWGNQIENVSEVYERTGIKRICREEDIQLVEFNKRCWRNNFPFTALIEECDHIINIPKLKTHGLTLLTAAVKNLFGLVCGTYKTELHKKYANSQDFSRMLVDIYAQVKPALNIVDGILAMEGDGPASAGKLRQCGLLLASADAVAVDSVLAMIMGLKPEEVYTNKEAAARNLGVADLGSIEILGEKLEGLLSEPFLLPKASLGNKIPQSIVNLVRRFIRYYPQVLDNKCIRCQACVRACPEKIISLKSGRITIHHSKCIACFCCQEVCPEAAIRTRRSILARLIGL